MMNRAPCLLKSLFVVAGLAAATPALAHPHLYTTMQTTVVTTPEGLIKSLRLRWNFDDTYTKFSLEGLDFNNNGTFEPDEIQPLTDENIKNLLESKYFTIAKQKDVEIPQGPVTVYGQDMEDGKLVLWFDLPFATPVDPRQGFVDIKVYDPDFFIAFDYAPEKPPKLEGKLPYSCGMDLKPLPSNEELEQQRQYLADKPQDWQPETPTDFGEMFAQSLVISCKE